VILGLELIQEMKEHMIYIRQQLKEEHDRQKCYVDAHKTNQSYEVQD
jgi:hypothetical protein